MLLMFDRCTGDETTQAVHRYADENNINTYMSDKFNPKEDSSYLQYLDANNLYGWVMIQPLPARKFNWLDPSEFTPDKIDSYVNCVNEDYLLEVDVRYPKELHDRHNHLPLMCENMKINGVEKLVSNLYDKKNYEHVLILEKVHRVIEFNQSA